MKRLFFLSLCVTALMSAGCPSKPKNGECKSSDDCKAQEGYGKVCVQGRCQECAADTDCQAGFVCRDNKCAPRPECSQDADCGAGKACQAGRCVAAAAPKPECESDAQCGANQSCQAGLCVAKQAPSGADAAAACSGEGHAVHFAFNRADLDTEARGALDAMVNCLKQAGNVALSVEGHCDERGTTEYNLHLGERRAEAVKKYLVNLGVAAKSVKAVSYGKERPVCSESTEDCYAKNRRGVVTPAGADRS
ncbi:MAG TPA: OmpA family protein [Anaeromyxobacteraceae bacterium]